METSDTTVKKDLLIDPHPLDSFEEIIQWSICGNIFVHLENLNYLVECMICKHRFYDNNLFIKHLHDIHNDIFTKEEFEPTNIFEEDDDDKKSCENPASENELQCFVDLTSETSDCKESSTYQNNLEIISNKEKDLQLELNNSCKTVQFKTKKIKSVPLKYSKKLKVSPSIKEIEVKPDNYKISLKLKSKCTYGIPESILVPINGIFQCTRCSKNYRSFLALRNHFWLKHTFQFKLNDENCVPDIPEDCPNPVDNYYHCTACLARFLKYESLLSHFRYHPGTGMIKNRPNKCSYCDLSFWTKCKLKAHEIMHTRERPFICEICSRGFMRKENLVDHVRIHNNDRRYKCSFCNTSCYTNYQRKQHELIHSNSKPNVCEICGVAYRLKFRLVMHMRRHTGERQAKCNICEKSFYDNRNLVEHMRIHTGEKKYVCKICHKGFTRRVHLKTHEKVHSDVKNYICKICNQGFKQQAGLYSHMKCVHGQKKTE